MKKKLFTLFTLLVLCVTGAWATDYTQLFSVTSPTNKTLTQNGITVSSDNNVADKAFGGADPAIKCYKIDSKQLNIKSTSANIRKIVFTACSAKDNAQTSLKIQTCATENGTYADATSTDITISGGESGTGTTETTNTIVCPYSTSYTTATIEFTNDVQFVHIVRSGETWVNSVQVFCESKTATSEVLKSSGAVKIGDAVLTLNDDADGYTVSSNTITLGSNILYVSTPSDIKLVKTITYSNSTTEDADVSVSFDGTITAGYYTGTASIGLTGSETMYTVKAKKDATPSVGLSETSGTITLLSYQPSGKKTVTLTGANLVDGTYDVTASVDGTTIAPTSFTVTDGEVDQEFTITSTASSAASTVFTFGTSAMGIAAPTYTLSYSKTAKRSVSQSTISTATSWTWADRASANIQLSNSTDPVKDTDFLLAEIAEITNSASFNSQALVVNGEYPYRKDGDNEFFQGQYIKFKTTVPGKLTVVYAGTNNNARRLQVNGKNYGDATATSSGNTTYKTASDIPVAAGDVIINGYQSAVSYLRFKSVSFTPLEDDEGDIVAVTDAAYATHVLADDIDFTQTAEVTAYKAQVDGDVIKLIEVDEAPAGTPLILAASKEIYELVHAASTPAAVTENDLQAGPVTGDGTNYYVLGKEGGNVGFGILANGVNLPATKAYIAASKFTSPAHFYSFDGETTGIETVEVKKVVNGVFYNLAGQQVAQPTKGLYIVNGRKVVIK